MKHLLFYRILTWLLLTIGSFMSLVLLSMLLAALANPILLFPVFMVACVVIYTYCSWRFLSKGIDAHQYCRPSLRDLIKVNGYGTLAFAFITGTQCLTLLWKPELLQEVMEQALSMQKSSVEGMEALMNRFMQYLLYFLAAYSLALIIHVTISFKLLRQHADAFEIPPNPEG